MRIGRKVFIGLLVLVLGSPYIPEMSFAQVGSEEDEISRHTPEFRFSVEEDLPVNRYPCLKYQERRSASQQKYPPEDMGIEKFPYRHEFGRGNGVPARQAVTGQIE